MAIPNEKAPVQQIGMTRDDLLAILAEIRKPIKSEKELREEEQQLISQKAMQETLKQAESLRVARQESCAHMRPDGSTRAVYIPDLNRLYCQECAKWIFPDTEPALFNKLYQLAL